MTGKARSTPTEPDFQQACGWWADLPNTWTPVGWKDHLFRFNVLWNGAVYAEPFLNRRTEQWRGQGVNLTVVPTTDPGKLLPGRRWPAYVFQDDGLVRQGWHGGEAPVLWSEWPAEGLLLRSDVFAHVPGGKEVETGIEPLFAWMRLSVHAALEALPLEKEICFIVRINAPALAPSMNMRAGSIGYPPYPRELRPHAGAYSAKDGLRLEEAGGIRLAVAPGRKCAVEFLPRAEGSNDAFLVIRVPAQVGAFVDLLVPMLPAERPIFLEELALGRAGALRQAAAFWRKRPATAATFQVPEEPINQSIRHSLKFAEVIAEKNPTTQAFSLLTGGLKYANLWATPFSMTCIMTLDALGYHAVVEKYLEIFRKEQGTVTPPGDCFQPHPGYLSTPKDLTSIDWLSDHGALLYTICEHALLSGDRDFAERWTDAIVKACEFIRYARSLTGHGGVEGILPPAVATDTRTKIQAVWNDGWNYKGLFTAARLLRQIGHPRADEFAAEAAGYRRTFREAFRRKTATMPAWIDARGRKHRLTPIALTGDEPWETRNAFYLDAGPLFPVYAGLLDAGDPLMRSTLRWFTEGPQTEFLRHDSNCWQVPGLDHGISTCEPCYSWNVFHSHQSGDRTAFLTSMYSLFAGVMSRQTWTMCETRGGISGLTPACLHIWMARLAVVDDEIADGELHLLRLAPRAWMGNGQRAVFGRMPTVYGPVTLETRVSRDGKTLDVTWRPEFRAAPRKVVLHAPPAGTAVKVRVNGKPVPAGRPVILPTGSGPRPVRGIRNRSWDLRLKQSRHGRAGL